MQWRAKRTLLSRLLQVKSVCRSRSEGDRDFHAIALIIFGDVCAAASLTQLFIHLASCL